MIVMTFELSSDQRPDGSLTVRSPPYASNESDTPGLAQSKTQNKKKTRKKAKIEHDVIN